MERLTTISDDLIRQFNLFRVNMLNKKLQIIEMGKELKRKTNLPGSMTFVKYLAEGPNPPIVRNEDATYSVNDKPVHKERLQTCVDEYNKAIQRNTKKPTFHTTVEEAIALLKSKGYKIMKPRLEWDEL